MGSMNVKGDGTSGLSHGEETEEPEEYVMQCVGESDLFELDPIDLPLNRSDHSVLDLMDH
jgi:hypothetical protein